MDRERLVGRFNALRQRAVADVGVSNAVETWLISCSPPERQRVNPYALAQATGLEVRSVVSALLDEGTQVDHQTAPALVRVSRVDGRSQGDRRSPAGLHRSVYGLTQTPFAENFTALLGLLEASEPSMRKRR